MILSACWSSSRIPRISVRISLAALSALSSSAELALLSFSRSAYRSVAFFNSPAKEQARASNAAALKAAEELRAEQAAHRRSEEKIAEMAEDLKNAADRYVLLEKEHKASSAAFRAAALLAQACSLA